MNTPVTLAIIGTAGRGSDAKILAANPDYYWAQMVKAALAVAELTRATRLTSGGAAWADHVAVHLALRMPERFTLSLYLPAPLVSVPGGPSERRFRDTGGIGSPNPGGTCNYYHDAFSSVCTTAGGCSSYVDLARAEAAQNVAITVGNGFYARNNRVADEADFALAMTFGDGPKLKDGGTAYTMRRFLNARGPERAFHLDLNSMRLCRRACAS